MKVKSNSSGKELLIKYGKWCFVDWECVRMCVICDYDRRATHTHTPRYFIVKVKICNILLVYYNKLEGVTEMFGGKISK